MKILFLGTPEIAAPFLEVCARRHQVVAAVTRADRPSGRGLQLASPPVKVLAEKLKIPVLQPEKPGSIAGDLRALGADMAVVVAYGKILKPEVLASTRLGFLNVHFSILPKYRGAAPMQWTLINGETRTGVTLFWLDEGMDTGPIQAIRETDVGPNEDVLDLGRKLVDIGSALLAENLELIAQGRIQKSAQRGQSSLAPKLTREDAQIRFEAPADQVHNRVRGLKAGPKPFFAGPNGSVAVLKTVLGAGNEAKKDAPGRILRVESIRGVLVQCTPGSIWVQQVQPEGKRQISAVDFVNGLRLKPGDSLLFNGQ